MIGWKIYTWILGALLLASYVLILTSAPAVVDIIDIPISAVAWTGLFGFSYGKAIVNSLLWRVWLIGLVAWDILYNLLFSLTLGIGQSIEGAAPISMADVVIGLLVFLPGYLALYLYGFRRPMIWNTEQT